MIPQEFPDAIALQFPIKNQDAPKPYFLNGNPQNAVSLWKWESNYPFRIQKLRAEGMQKISPQAGISQETTSRAEFEYGQYRVVMKRSLTTPEKDKDVQFKSGAKVGLAFNAWDGTSGENGNKMSISSWFDLMLE